MRRVTRVLAAAALCLPVTVAATVTRSGGAAPSCAEAAGMHHAALVVEHGSSATVTVCVAFSADSITGDQLLAMSNVQYATVDYPGVGKAVCQIDREPATYPPGCWTASSPYWAVYVSRGSRAWTSSGLGISVQTFRDGDAEGFRYEGQGDSSPPPLPADVCPAPVTSPPPSAAPTPRPAGADPAARSAAQATAAPATSTAAAPVSPISPGGTRGGSPRVAPVAQRSGPRPVVAAAGDTRGWLAAAGAGLLLLLGLGYRLVRAR